MIDGDKKTWDIYANGITCCVNQCEKEATTNRVKKYKPQNLAELSSFIAAIRPGFASLLSTFLNREPYTTGEKKIDDLLSDTAHFMIYQESIMKVLSFLELKMAETYGVIKNISKKKYKLHPEMLKELQERLIEGYIIGKNDMKLAQTLIKAGNEHRKFMRQIFISVDITAPIYWWKEFDTYKVGTTVNSTSTMHKLATTPITLECFEIDDYDDTLVTTLPDGDEEDPGNWTMYSSEEPKSIIDWIESLRLAYLETKDKRYWKELIRWLPESWLQTRTVTMNYENVRNMYFQRKNHKLTEWSESFIKWVESLPYAKELIMYEG